jgi:hypothetical protein
MGSSVLLISLQYLFLVADTLSSCSGSPSWQSTACTTTDLQSFQDPDSTQLVQYVYSQPFEKQLLIHAQIPSIISLLKGRIAFDYKLLHEKYGKFDCQEVLL